jgi:hypothetical protein
MPLIRETIVTTVDGEGRVHVAPIGLIADGTGWIIAPFRPSATLDNLAAMPFAVANHTDDVRIFAGCLTGRRNWRMVPAQDVPVPRLADALSHAELAVAKVTEDWQRPRFHCRVVRIESHAPFEGLCRAKAAVVEAAILVSRLHLLPADQIAREIAHLAVAVEKTAGEAEREAWGWLMEKIRAHEAQRAAAS